MSIAVCAFPEDLEPAMQLAAILDCPLSPIRPRQFPDGESCPTVRVDAPTILLYRRLDRPDAKLMPLLLAADALRRAGAMRLVLVAPYMPYLRQDRVFEDGQPLSRDVLGRLVGQAFERIVTVEPHLHRTRSLAAVFAGAVVTPVSVAPLFTEVLAGRPKAIVVGPDIESGPWTSEIARRSGRTHLLLEKTRISDQEVRLIAPAGLSLARKSVVLVDDICSTGGTIEAAARLLRQAGARSIDTLICHALFDPAVLPRWRALGIDSVKSTDACAHPTNAMPLASLLAQALRQEGDPAS